MATPTDLGFSKVHEKNVKVCAKTCPSTVCLAQRVQTLMIQLRCSFIKQNICERESVNIGSQVSYSAITWGNWNQPYVREREVQINFQDDVKNYHQVRKDILVLKNLVEKSELWVDRQRLKSQSSNDEKLPGHETPNSADPLNDPHMGIDVCPITPDMLIPNRNDTGVADLLSDSMRRPSVCVEVCISYTQHLKANISVYLCIRDSHCQ